MKPWRVIPLAAMGGCLALQLLGVSRAGAATSAITWVGTSAETGSSTVRSVTGGTPSTTTWEGDRTQLNSFILGSTQYFSDVTGQVIVRRNTASSTFPDTNADQVMTWTYRISDDEGSPPNVSVYGEYHNTYAPHLGQNNIQTGIENAFANDLADFSLNVERIDFVFDTPITITSDHHIALFERGGGGSGANNGFGIAAITGISGLDATGYSSPVFVPLSAWDSSPGLLPSEQYDVYRYDVDGGPELDFRAENGTQHLVGLALPGTDLVSAGTEIYGYSVFAEDVTAVSGADLVDWDDATFFPTDTNSADGDLDLSSIGAQIWTVPEPSSALLVAGGVLLLLGRRRR